MSKLTLDEFSNAVENLAEENDIEFAIVCHKSSTFVTGIYFLNNIVCVGAVEFLKSQSIEEVKKSSSVLRMAEDK